jgi:thiosulfate dehydrogenase [quinone] large subunit
MAIAQDLNDTAKTAGEAGRSSATKRPGRRIPTPSAGWTGTSVRVLFGVVFGVDAVLKWLPGYRKTYLSALKSAAASQPTWLHGWFHFWITLQSKSPMLFATITGLAESGLALVLILGVARRAGYLLGVVYSLLVWGVAEGFGGPYASGSTDVGTGIVYALLFITLLTFAPPARRERLSLDRLLVARWPSWRVLAEPHAVDRVSGAPQIEPIAVGTQQSS